MSHCVLAEYSGTLIAYVHCHSRCSICQSFSIHTTATVACWLLVWTHPCLEATCICCCQTVPVSSPSQQFIDLLQYGCQFTFGRVTAILGTSPLRVFQSMGFTDAAATLISTSPLRLLGFGKSVSYLRTEGGPKLRNTDSQVEEWQASSRQPQGCSMAQRVQLVKLLVLQTEC